MREFTEGELARFRTVQTGHMQDTCQVLSYGHADDRYNNPTVTYTEGDPQACGVGQRNPREVQESGDVPLVDVWIRLSLTTSVEVNDRIRVTHRYGDVVTTSDYEVVGPVLRGPSGLVVGCESKVGT
jgi:hypothetical protein